MNLLAIEAQAELICREWELDECEADFDDECKIRICGYQHRSGQEWIDRTHE